MWRCHQLRLLAHLAPFNFPGRGPTRHRGRVAHGRRPRTARIVSRVGASGCLWVPLGASGCLWVAFGIAAAANSRAGAFWLWVALGCSFGGAPQPLSACESDSPWGACPISKPPIRWLCLRARHYRGGRGSTSTGARATRSAARGGASRRTTRRGRSPRAKRCGCWSSHLASSRHRVMQWLILAHIL